MVQAARQAGRDDGRCGDRPPHREPPLRLSSRLVRRRTRVTVGLYSCPAWSVSSAVCVARTLAVSGATRRVPESAGSGKRAHHAGRYDGTMSGPAPVWRLLWRPAAFRARGMLRSRGYMAAERATRRMHSCDTPYSRANDRSDSPAATRWMICGRSDTGSASRLAAVKRCVWPACCRTDGATRRYKCGRRGPDPHRGRPCHH